MSLGQKIKTHKNQTNQQNTSRKRGKTNIPSLKLVWSLLGPGPFSGAFAVSFRECTSLQSCLSHYFSTPLHQSQRQLRTQLWNRGGVLGWSPDLWICGSIIVSWFSNKMKMCLNTFGIDGSFWISVFNVHEWVSCRTQQCFEAQDETWNW